MADEMKIDGMTYDALLCDRLRELLGEVPGVIGFRQYSDGIHAFGSSGILYNLNADADFFSLNNEEYSVDYGGEVIRIDDDWQESMEVPQSIVDRVNEQFPDAKYTRKPNSHEWRGESIANFFEVDITPYEGNCGCNCDCKTDDS